MQRLYSKPLTNITVNVSLVGMNGSGKSALLVKYLTRRFIVEYAPYLSDSYTKNDNIDGQDVTLNIQDTSDSDDIDLADIVKWSQAIIILFSITSRRSFYRAQELIESIKQNVEPPSRPDNLRTSHSIHSNPPVGPNPSPNMPIPANSLIPGQTSSLRRSAMCGVRILRAPTVVLVASKSDLDRFRLVEKTEIEQLAKRYNVPLFETTAAETYEDVQSVFHAIVRLSYSGRFNKSRTQEGLSGPGSRSLSSSTGTLSGATNSVLSSLAVSPGLLLQRKTLPTGPTLLLPENNSGSVNMDAEQSSGPAHRLTNLKFRAASPPAFTKTLRSPSPILPQNRPHQAECVAVSSAAHNQSPTTNRASSEFSAETVGPSLPNHARFGDPNKQSIAPEEGVTAKVANVTTSRTNTHVPAQPPPSQSKRSPMAFRFFSKKTK